MPTRIERIIDLEKRAQVPEAVADKLKWEAAHLYWQEVTDNGRTKAEIAKEIGKSAMHVLYMYRCWERIVVQPGLDYGNDYGNLPPFNAAYNSDTVRESDDEHDKAPDEKKHRDHDREDFSAHGLAQSAADAISSLAENPAFWPLLTDDDVSLLRDTKDKLRVLIRDIGR